MLDETAKAVEGFAASDSIPITGDSTAHPVRWRSAGTAPIGKPVRLRLQAKDARVYSIYLVGRGEKPVYHRFTAARP